MASLLDKNFNMNANIWDSLTLDQTPKHLLKHYRAFLLSVWFLFAVYFLCYRTIAIAIIYYESEVESLNVQMKATSTFVCLPTGWVTLPLSPQKCTRSDLRMSEIPNFSWGGGGHAPTLPTPLVETVYRLTNQKLLPTALCMQAGKQTDRQREHPKGI